MHLHAYRRQEHSADKICLQWDRQMPPPVGDWMLAWAIEEGSDTAVSRAKCFEGHLASRDAWPESYKTAWDAATIRDARRQLCRMGPPSKQCDVDALEETQDVLDWAERMISDGAEIMCVHDF